MTDELIEYQEQQTQDQQISWECYLITSSQNEKKSRRRPAKKIKYIYHKKKKRPLNTVVEVEHQKGLTIKLKTRITSACYFTLLEDQKILEMVLASGPKFNKISKLFPGKTISMVKNRYYKYLRYKWDQILGSQYTFMNQTDCSTTEGQTCLR